LRKGFNGSFDQILCLLFYLGCLDVRLKSQLCLAFRLESERSSMRSFSATNLDRLLSEYYSITSRTCPINEDAAASRRCAARGAVAYADRRGIHLSHFVQRETLLGQAIIVHELAHMMQLYNGAAGGPFDPPALLEREATTVERGALRSLSNIVGKASPESVLTLWWLIPIATGVYSLLRPSVANAPAPADKVYPSVSTGQVAAEAFALFAIPGAGYAISGRLGLGWVSSSAISGSLATTSFRGVQDVAHGEFSGATVYNL
jgi:hypothetical protein